MTGTFISLHAAARDEVRRQAAVAEALRGRRHHTRASVADQLNQPAAGHPPIFRDVQAAHSRGAQR